MISEEELERLDQEETKKTQEEETWLDKLIQDLKGSTKYSG